MTFPEEIKRMLGEFPEDMEGAWDVLISKMGTLGMDQSETTFHHIFIGVVDTGLGTHLLGVQHAMYASAALVMADDYNEATTAFLQQRVVNGLEAMKLLAHGSLDERRAESIEKAREWQRTINNLGSLAAEMKETIEDPDFSTSAICLPDVMRWASLGKPKLPPRHEWVDGACTRCKADLEEYKDSGGPRICTGTEE